MRFLFLRRWWCRRAGHRWALGSGTRCARCGYVEGPWAHLADLKWHRGPGPRLFNSKATATLSDAPDPPAVLTSVDVRPFSDPGWDTIREAADRIRERDRVALRDSALPRRGRLTTVEDADGFPTFVPVPDFSTAPTPSAAPESGFTGGGGGVGGGGGSSDSYTTSADTPDFSDVSGGSSTVDTNSGGTDT